MPLKIRTMTSLFCAIWVLKASGASPNLLTNLAQIYLPGNATVAMGLPVRVQAVVTYADLPWNLLFLQDATGTHFQLPTGITNEPAVGDWVELTGVTTLINQIPSLDHPQLRILSRRELPQPVPADETGLLSGDLSSRWVEVEGIVRNASPEGERLRLDIMKGRSRLESYVRRVPAQGSNYTALIGARVRVRGVCSNRFKDHRIAAAGLMIPDLACLTILSQPTLPLKHYPVTSVASVWHSESTGEKATRLRVQGVVVASRNSNLTLRDETGSISIMAFGQQAVKVYDRVEVWGFPALSGQERILEDAMVEPVTDPGSLTALQPLLIDREGVLQTVREVRAISRDQAATGVPVRLQGVVTYADRSWQHFFLQDESGAIYINNWQEDLAAGQYVAVEGVTEPGMVAHMVANATVRRLALTNLPSPGRFGLKELMSIDRDCSWVELEGVVRSVEDLPAHAKLQMANREGSFEAVIPNVGGGSEFRSLVDAEVRLRGVNTVNFDERGRFVSVQMRIPDSRGLQVLVPAPADPFGLATRPIGAIRNARTALLGMQRIRVQGRITLVMSDGSWCVQDGTGALRVSPLSTHPAQVGDGVDVTGFPEVKGSSTELIHALFRPAPGVAALVPRTVRTEEILPEGRFHRELISIEGRLVTDAGGTVLPSLLIQSGGVVFPAQFETQNQKLRCPVWRAGSLVRLTGLCTVQFHEQQTPHRFLLLLRSPSDVALLQQPPWWTLQHTAVFGGGLSAIVLAVLAWVQLLRIQVRDKTQQIRQRLQAEAALEKNFTLVWETTTEGMRMADAQGLTVKVNLAYCQLVQKSRSELEGQPLTLAFAENERAVLLDEYHQFFQGGDVPASQERQWTLWNGRQVWFELTHTRLARTAGPPLLLSQFRDITERKRTEVAVRESEVRFRTLAENIPGVIYLCHNDARYTMIYLNDAVEDLTGYPKEEFFHHRISFVDLYHPDDAVNIPQEVNRALDQHQPFRLVYRLRRRQGDWRWVEEHGVGRFVENKLVLLEGFLHDITERQHAEEERQRLQGQLIQAQKMESVGRLAGGVAHDFNNMLQAILGHAALLLQEIPPGSPWRESLEEIQNSAQRSTELTRQLLAFARKQTVMPKVLDMNDTITGMLKMLRRLIGENIQLVWSPRTPLWPIKIDPGQMDQVLANLCVNARDAIGGPGHLIIQTENVIVTEALVESSPESAPGEYVLLSVSDDGSGMDEETLSHLFEPFFTTKEVGRGTGLGLATVYGIVRQNNGFIRVDSQPGQGTRFRIYWPRHHTHAVLTPVETTEIVPTAHGETVLVVEDEPAILKTARKMLGRLGYTVLTANTPQEALTLATEHSGKIHLVLTDVVMPEMNGRDLGQRLTATHPGLKCLFMSGYTADVIAHHGVVEEGVHFLQKPFSQLTLANKIREALTPTVPAGGPTVKAG